MKKLIILLMLLSLNLLASDRHSDEVLSYSDFNLNESLSVYAGKINMDYFLEDEALSIGFLLHDNTHSDFEFGCGYIQPSSKFIHLTEVEPALINKVDDDGVLFFINYNF